MKVTRRVVSLFLIMLWWGGLTFYSAIVVPIGTNVLQSSEQQGLVTQQVTKYLNALGLVAAVVLAWNAWQYRAIAKTKLFRGLLVGCMHGCRTCFCLTLIERYSTVFIVFTCWLLGCNGYQGPLQSLVLLHFGGL
jgi:uncharacterized membrane protein